MTQFIIAAGSGIGVQETTLAHSATLSWQASPDSVQGYNVYRSNTSGTEGGSPLNGASLVAGLTYVDSTIQVGQKYFYVVTAVENGFESVHSNEAQTSVLLPAAPTALVVSAVS